MKKFLATFFLFVLSPLWGYADTLVLKNGMRFDSKQIWEQNGEIKCNVKGVVLGFPKKDVLHIERADKQGAGKTDIRSDIQPGGLTSDGAGRTRSALERRKKELEKEYLALSEELDRLSQNKQKDMSAIEIRKHIEDVSGYNKKVAEYEKKRKAYIDDVKAFNDEKQDAKRDSIDPEQFEKILESWVGKPLSDFIGKWGEPDDSFDASDGRRGYLFVVEITPTNMQRIYFTTDASGKIMGYGKTKPGD